MVETDIRESKLRKPLHTAPLSLLDILFCAFGAVIILGVLFSAFIRSKPVQQSESFFQLLVEVKEIHCGITGVPVEVLQNRSFTELANIVNSENDLIVDIKSKVTNIKDVRDAFKQHELKIFSGKLSVLLEVNLDDDKFQELIKPSVQINHYVVLPDILNPNGDCSKVVDYSWMTSGKKEGPKQVTNARGSNNIVLDHKIKCDIKLFPLNQKTTSEDSVSCHAISSTP